MDSPNNDRKENDMKSIMITLIAVGMLFLLIADAAAQENLVETIANGCKVEIEKFCSRVTPGEGRILACLYAYQDKLSGKCEYALYDAAVQLERAVAALSYVANECEDDLDKHCSEVPVGEGRLLNCLEKNDKQVSKRCKQALKEVGLK